MKVCEICGCSINENDVYEMDGQLLCADCYY
ncbi:MAG: LIM domain-containing protein [Clostridia bacterium]|nr:LIM domain-containing protein [Oscillospiraceae bacterium]